VVAAGWAWFGADWERKPRSHRTQAIESTLLFSPTLGFPAPNTTVFNPLELSVSCQSDTIFLFAWFSVFPWLHNSFGLHIRFGVTFFYIYKSTEKIGNGMQSS
jgi:hypothetical protein